MAGVVGFVTDARMMSHANLWDPLHIECPARLGRPIDMLNKYALLEQCTRLESRFATDDELKAVHKQEYIDHIRETQSMSLSELHYTSGLYEDVFVCAETNSLARLSAGCALQACEAVVEDRVATSFALIRPPGHHASADRGCGFCIFNNVAICAKTAVNKWGLERVLIVDWDVHAAQGTQYSIANDSRIKLISIHRFEHGDFWPSTHESNWDTSGNTINVPLNETGMGDLEYMLIMHQLILPLIDEYKPQLVLVSAGYDAALGDPQGEMRVSPMGFAHMTHALLTAMHGRRVCCLYEGGYFLDSVELGVIATLRTLLGDAPPLMTLSGRPSVKLNAVLYSIAFKRRHESTTAANLYNTLRAWETQHNGGVQVFEALPVAPFNGLRELAIPQSIEGNYPPRPDEVIANLQAQLKAMILTAKQPGDISYAECFVLDECRNMDDIVATLIASKASNVFVLGVGKRLRWTLVDGGAVRFSHHVDMMTTTSLRLAFHQAIIPLLYTDTIAQAVIVNTVQGVDKGLLEEMVRHTRRVVGRVQLFEVPGDAREMESVDARLDKAALEMMATLWHIMNEHSFFAHLKQRLPQA